MADAGINIEVMYSDHDNQLIRSSRRAKARAVAKAWMAATKLHHALDPRSVSIAFLFVSRPL